MLTHLRGRPRIIALLRSAQHQLLIASNYTTCTILLSTSVDWPVYPHTWQSAAVLATPKQASTSESMVLLPKRRGLKGGRSTPVAGGNPCITLNVTGENVIIMEVNGQGNIRKSVHPIDGILKHSFR